MVAKWLAALVGVLTVGMFGCTDRDRPVALEKQSGTPPRVAAEYVEQVEPVPYQLFLREMAEDPGRAVYHLLVPPGAEGLGLHRALTEFLRSEADRDQSLAAIRAIAYVSRQTKEEEASLLPIMWAEWVPPEGWSRAGPTRSKGPYRIYTYQEIPPEW